MRLITLGVKKENKYYFANNNKLGNEIQIGKAFDKTDVYIFPFRVFTTIDDFGKNTKFVYLDIDVNVSDKQLKGLKTDAIIYSKLFISGKVVSINKGRYTWLLNSINTNIFNQKQLDNLWNITSFDYLTMGAKTKKELNALINLFEKVYKWTGHVDLNMQDKNFKDINAISEYLDNYNIIVDRDGSFTISKSEFLRFNKTHKLTINAWRLLSTLCYQAKNIFTSLTIDQYNDLKDAIGTHKAEQIIVDQSPNNEYLTKINFNKIEFFNYKINGISQGEKKKYLYQDIEPTREYYDDDDFDDDYDYENYEQIYCDDDEQEDFLQEIFESAFLTKTEFKQIESKLFGWTDKAKKILYKTIVY